MLNIEMKMVMPLGQGRVQLECMCGEQFTYGPKEKINTLITGKGKTARRQARCPKCNTTWNGSIDDLSSTVKLSVSFFGLYARLDNPELNKQLGIDEKPDGCVRIGVGMGADIAHFAMSAIARFCEKNEPVILIVKKIEKTEYEEARMAQIEKQRAMILASSMGTLGLFAALADKFGSPDEDEDEEDPDDKG